MKALVGMSGPTCFGFSFDGATKSRNCVSIASLMCRLRSRFRLVRDRWLMGIS
jgi:hypothetical protein